jgi:hypothetical protein
VKFCDERRAVAQRFSDDDFGAPDREVLAKRLRVLLRGEDYERWHALVAGAPRNGVSLSFCLVERDDSRFKAGDRKLECGIDVGDPHHVEVIRLHDSVLDKPVVGADPKY